MQRGFRDVNGACVPFESIDIVRDAQRFNSSPATLAMLIDQATKRKGIDFSASQLNKTPRQHLLEARDYYPTTGQAMSGFMGTMKHEQINVTRDRLIVEQRFTSKRNPRLSGQIDHAAIVELTNDGTLVVDLYDLKTVKWYSVTLIAKDIWKNHPDYAWQLNLCAAMMEESIGAKCRNCNTSGMVDADGDDPRCTHGSPEWCGLTACGDCRGNGFIPIRVRNLYLECIPADSSYKQEDEAQKLGFTEFQKVTIPIERKTADETYAVFEEAMALRDKAITDGYAPVCEDRWTNRTIKDLRCRHYCSVAAECKAFSLAVPEWHPLASDEELLAASIEIAQQEAV